MNRIRRLVVRYVSRLSRELWFIEIGIQTVSHRGELNITKSTVGRSHTRLYPHSCPRQFSGAAFRVLQLS